MPEIIFEIDERTGDMTSEIKGLKGHGCDDILKMVESLTGQATSDERTPEFFQRVQETQTVRRG